MDIGCIQYLYPYTTFPEFTPKAEYSPTFTPFVTIFTVAVALNFAYAASAGLRNALMNGFITSIQRMAAPLEILRKDNGSLILSADELSEKDNTLIQNTLSELANQISSKFALSEKELTVTKEGIANKVKPIYVVSAIYSLFILFLTGQEGYHQLLPRDALIPITITSNLLILIIFILSFTKHSITNTSKVGGWLIIVNLFFTFYPIIPDDLFTWIKNKYLLDSAILLAYSSFAFVTLRLLILQYCLKAKYYFIFTRIKLKLKSISIFIKNTKLSNNLLSTGKKEGIVSAISRNLAYCVLFKNDSKNIFYFSWLCVKEKTFKQIWNKIWDKGL